MFPLPKVLHTDVLRSGLEIMTFSNHLIFLFLHLFAKGRRDSKIKKSEKVSISGFECNTSVCGTVGRRDTVRISEGKAESDYECV